MQPEQRNEEDFKFLVLGTITITKQSYTLQQTVLRGASGLLEHCKLPNVAYPGNDTNNQ